MVSAASAPRSPRRRKAELLRSAGALPPKGGKKKGSRLDHAKVPSVSSWSGETHGFQAMKLPGDEIFLGYIWV